MCDSIKLVCVDCQLTYFVSFDYDVTENECYVKHHNLWVVGNNNWKIELVE